MRRWFFQFDRTPDQHHRPTGAGVFCPPSGIVGAHPPLDIVCHTCVETAIPTPQQIRTPGILNHVLHDGILRKEKKRQTHVIPANLARDALSCPLSIDTQHAVMLRTLLFLSVFLLGTLPAIDAIIQFRPDSNNERLSMMGGNGSEQIQLDDKGKGEWKLPGRLVRFSRKDDDSLRVESAPIDAKNAVGSFVEHTKSRYRYEIPYTYVGENLNAHVSIFSSRDVVHLWGSAAITATCSKTRFVLFDNLNGIFGEISKSKMLITPLEGHDQRVIFGSPLPVFSIINFEGALHNFQAVPNRPGFWHLSPYTGPLAPVRLTSSATTQRCRISLVGKTGSMGAVGFAGETIQVVPGEYILSKPTIRLSSASSSTAHWLSPDYADPDASLQVSSTGAQLHFGPPLRLVAKAFRSKDQVTLSEVTLVGAAQERYSTRDPICSVQWALVKGESRQDVGKLEYG